MLKHRMTVMLSVLVLLSMVLSACTVAAPAAPPAAPAAEGGEASWWRMAAEAAGCQDVTLRGVSESTPPTRFAAEVLAPAFEAETGIKVELEPTSWDEMYTKAINDMQAGTGIYDFVYIEQDIIYQYLANNYLTNMTQLLADNPELASPDFDFAKFTSFIDNFKDADGNIYGVPMEAFLKVYLYRLDLFSDPAIQEAFKAQYGYDLAPATTHQQYQDIADFFTQYGEDNGLELWGTTVQGATGHASSFYEFFESIAPTFGVYNWGINQENWKATVENGGEMNSDAAKAALAFWVGLLADAPPEATASTWDEVAASFAAGRAAQGWVYGENAAWIAIDPERSKVVGNVGVALPPVAEGVMADAESGAGYIGYYDGGAFGLPVSSKNQLCTLLWMQYIGQESVQADWAIAGSRIVMESTYTDPKVLEVDAKTDNYYSRMKESGPLFRGAPPFPFHSALREVVQPFIWKALSGELPPADALDQAAAAADAELVNLGYGQ
jgi:multiple sugar transport system substrate-binding protein